jgi:putative FmdB family regulatory protein
VPFYEYKCKKCETEFEELVPVGTTETPPCPECGSTQVEKLMSLFGSAGSSGDGGAACGPSGFT